MGKRKMKLKERSSFPEAVGEVLGGPILKLGRGHCKAIEEWGCVSGWGTGGGVNGHLAGPACL